MAPTLRNNDSSDVYFVETDPFLVTAPPFNNKGAVVPSPLLFDGDEVNNIDGKNTVLPSFEGLLLMLVLSLSHDLWAPILVLPVLRPSHRYC